ncbi:MAG TPA: hypothetical protein VEK11_09870 [Thermoanaerobaculia bacterium]|nr:hypothetical protein [Thermoanaerobaculia bacterium]
MRERFFAVGCGGLALLLAFLTLGVTTAGVYVGEGIGSVIFGWITAGLIALAAFASFAIAIRRGTTDEDLFEGNRGLAVALTVVVILAVTAFVLVTFMQPDFWRGATGQ